MARAQSERQLRNTTPYERPAHSRANRPEEQRESAFQSFSRSISHAFSRAVGRVSGRDASPHGDPDTDQERRDGEFDASNAGPRDEPSAISDSTAEDLNVSQTSKVPASASREFSAVRKPSIDFTLLKRQSDLRVPAQLIIDAYRDALRQRASKPPAEKLELGDRPGHGARTLNMKMDDSVIPAQDNVSMLVPSNNPPVVIRRPAGVSKQRRKPLNHRIQLITKPMVDLSQIPDDRRHRPGFISANFDVSDDDNDADEEKNTTESPSVPFDTAGSLLRRPQKESSRLKQTAEKTEQEKPKEQEQQTTAPSQDKQKISSSIFATQASEKSSESSEKNPKPLFSFSGSKPSAGAPAGKPSAPLFGSASSPQTSSLEPVESKATNTIPSFGLGSNQGPSTGAAAVSSTATKPDLDAASKPKPTFNFSFKGPDSNGATPKEQPTNALAAASSQSALPPAPKSTASTFSFGQPKQGESKEQDTATEKPKFNFGGPSENDSRTSTAAAPASAPLKFNFGGTATPTGDGGSLSEPPNASTPSNGATKPAGPGGFTFGQQPLSNSAETNKEAGTPSAANFAFGASTSASAPAKKPDAPVFNFGAPSSSSTAPAPFAFGSTAPKSDKPVVPAAPFGAPAQQPPQGEATKPVNSPSLFNNAATGGSAFGGPQPPSFGFNTKPSTENQFNFGKVEKPLAPESNSSAFGGTNGSTTNGTGSANGVAPFQFGKSTSQPPAQPSAFGAAGKSATPQPFSFIPPAASSGGGTPGALGGAFGSSAPKDAHQSGLQAPVAPFSVASNSATPAPAGFGAFQAPANNAALPASTGPNNFMPGSNSGTPQPQNGQASSRDSTPGAGIAPRRIAQVKRRLNRK